MKENNTISIRRKEIENFGILCILFIVICSVLSVGVHFASMQRFVYGKLELRHTVRLFISITLIITILNLYKRFYKAWVVTEFFLIISVLINLMDYKKPLHFTLTLLEFSLFILFFYCKNDFCRYESRGKIKALSTTEKEKVRQIVLKYGQNPGSYLSLEDDKTIFFSQKTDGILAYGIVGDTVVVNGDPICPPSDFEMFLQEFHNFCKANIYNCIFLSVTDTFLPIYHKMGCYGIQKCGEEPRLDVQSFSLAGKAGARIRADINHAQKANLTVKEYRPLEYRDNLIEKAFSNITKEWLSTKNGTKLSFTLGGTSFDDPMDRRYFYAVNDSEQVLGFVVFTPFDNKNGYLADVTRQVTDAPSGIMQLIIYQALLTFRDEHVTYLSLGLAPLVDENTSHEGNEMAAKALHYIYEHMNHIYGFKNLHLAKSRYNPQKWVPGYFVFEPRILSLESAYAAVSIQNPNGLRGFLKI